MFLFKISSITAHRILASLALVGLGLMTSSTWADEYTDVSKLINTKQYNEALSKVDLFLTSKPRDPQMRFLKGVLQSEMGKTSDATSTFTQLTEDYPELPEPYNNLAVIYAAAGKLDKARAVLEMAIRTNPSYATAYENLGDTYAKLASQSYAKALQLDAKNAAVPSKLSLIRELFAPGSSKPGATPVAAAPAPAAANPVVAPVQPKLPAIVTAAPTPSGKPNIAPPAVVNASSEGEIQKAVNNWAHAWGSRDMNGYLASYTKDYTPRNKQTNSAWAEERKARILGKNKITLKISNVTIDISANGLLATVKFRQDYRADTLSTSSRKTLELVKTGDRWLISKEITG